MVFVVLGDSFTFPEGNAATNRVYTYAKGLIENGINTHVICFENEYLVDYNGISEGIQYYHPFGQKERNNFFIIRRWLKLKKYFRTYKLVKAINKKDKIVAINLWTYKFPTLLFAAFLAKIIKTKMVIEQSEHPLRYYRRGFFNKLYGKIKLWVGIKLYDGIFCISNYLVDFYAERGFSRHRILLVPSTVDPGRFKGIFIAPFSFEYIGYCGTLTLQKDGVNILIKSFKKISVKFPDIKLVLIGKGATFKEEIAIRNLVSTLGCERRIIFLGQISRNEVPTYLFNARLLALARPRSIVADAGFPSKLTEYLATGNPVVVTKVGEIPIYLKDYKNAFLSEPDSVDAFADKLDYALSNYDLAKEVGRKGKELTVRVFNYNYQARNMIKFINAICNKS